MGNTIHHQQQQWSKNQTGVKKQQDGDPYGSHKQDKPVRAHLNAIFTFPETNEVISYFLHHIILTEHRMKKGLELWGEKGVAAVKKEMK